MRLEAEERALLCLTSIGREIAGLAVIYVPESGEFRSHGLEQSDF